MKARPILGAIFLVLSIGTAGPRGASAAAAVTAYFLDTWQAPTASETIQTFVAPGDSFATGGHDQIDGEVLVDVSDGSTAQSLAFQPPVGTKLAVGAYAAHQNADAVNAGFHRGPGDIGCTATFTITALAWAPVDVLQEFSASFHQTCGDTHFYGEIRINSTAAMRSAAIKDAETANAPMLLDIPKTFVGRTSSTGSIKLANTGTVPLTYGTGTLSGVHGNAVAVDVDTCSNSTIAVGAWCEIGLRATFWMPGSWEDTLLTLPANTARGAVSMHVRFTFLAATFVPIPPTRLVDTRIDNGLAGPLRHAQGRTFTATNRTPADPLTNIPATAVAVTGNLTVVGQTAAGHVALTTTATDAPAISTVNFPVGDVRGNGTSVRLGVGGTLGVTYIGIPGASTDVVFDATGYYIPSDSGSSTISGNFTPADPPVRILDTRSGIGLAGTFRARTPRTLTIPLLGVLSDTEAIVGNLVVIGASRGGYLAVTPTATAAPTTSTLNFPANDVRANNVVARLGATPGAGKTISITYVAPAGSTAHVVFDVTGYYGHAGMGYVPLVPSRAVDTRINQGLAGRLRAGIARTMDLDNRQPGDPSRNVPPWSYDPPFPIDGYTGNLAVTGQTRAGHVAIVGPSAPIPPATSTINVPLGDTRANGFTVGSSVNGLLRIYYGAPVGATTNVVVDITGYFTH